MDAMVDLYPSRVDDQPRLLPRRDPVVHSEPRDWEKGPLDRESVEQFVRDGFLAFPQFFGPEEVRAWREELDRLRESERGGTRAEVIKEPNSNAVRSIFAVHRDNPVFARLARNSRIVRMIEQLLGSKVYITQSRVNFKPGFAGKEFYWHSDFETWHTEDGMARMRAISVNIALTENTPHNGPLMLIPGSHKHFVSCVGRTPADHYRSSLKRQEYGVPDPDSLEQLYREGGIAAPTGKAGSLVLFECNTMHGSNSNITPLPRSNVFMVYNSVENALTWPFAAKHPRPEFLAARSVDPIEAQ